MEKAALDFTSAEAAMTSRRDYTIRLGTPLDRAFFEWCQKPDFGLVEIMSLFPKNRDLKAKFQFDCEFPCPQCGEWRWERLGRGKIHILISHLKFPKGRFGPYQLFCDACVARDEAERARVDPDEVRRIAITRLLESSRQPSRM